MQTRKLIGSGRLLKASRVLSGRADVAAVAFKLDFGDAVEGHVHFGEPGGDGFFSGSFHDADGLAFGQVGKTAIPFDSRILLGRLGKLVKLGSRECARRNGVCAHEFCHSIVSFCSCFLRLTRPAREQWCDV